jgi:hypothetical protein
MTRKYSIIYMNQEYLLTIMEVGEPFYKKGFRYLDLIHPKIIKFDKGYDETW